MAVSTIARKDWIDSDGVVHKNDIYLEHGQFALVSGSECYAQTIEAVIKTVYGEVDTDRTIGIPYMTTVFRNTRTQESWAIAVRMAVRELDFVQEIVSFTYGIDSSAEKFNYELTVKTDAGTVTVTG